MIGDASFCVVESSAHTPRCSVENARGQSGSRAKIRHRHTATLMLASASCTRKGNGVYL